MLDWQIPPTWGLRKLGFLAPEESLQVVPKTQPERTFNYWGLDAISQGQFDEPQSNLVSGSSIASTCISFSNQHILYAKLRPYLNKVIVPTVDGIGTTEWIVLKPKPEFVDRYYLAYALRTQHFVDHITTSSAGARMPRARKEILFDSEIPIPYPDEPTRSLETQRRIVARLEALLAEVQETRQLRCSILDDANLLGQAIFFRGEWEATMQRMGELVSQKPLDVIVNDETEYLFAGVKSFGRGVFPSKSKKGFETSYRQLTRLSTGDFTYPKLMAWEGALGIVSPECDGMVVSPEFPVFQVHTNKILPEVLDVYFKTPSIWERLAALSTGSNARRRRLHPNAFLDYEFPVPPKHIQQQIHEAHVFLTEYKKSYNDDENSLGILEQTFLAQAFRGEL